MIDVTNLDIHKLIAGAYNLSIPVGMGMLHYEEGCLSEEEIASLIITNDEVLAVSMDYVKGRACKFNIFKKEGKLLINDDWFDHSPEQLEQLLESSVSDYDQL